MAELTRRRGGGSVRSRSLWDRPGESRVPGQEKSACACPSCRKWGALENTSPDPRTARWRSRLRFAHCRGVCEKQEAELGTLVTGHPPGDDRSATSTPQSPDAFIALGRQRVCFASRKVPVSRNSPPGRHLRQSQHPRWPAISLPKRNQPRDGLAASRTTGSFPPTRR